MTRAIAAIPLDDESVAIAAALGAWRELCAAAGSETIVRIEIRRGRHYRTAEANLSIGDGPGAVAALKLCEDVRVTAVRHEGALEHHVAGRFRGLEVRALVHGADAPALLEAFPLCKVAFANGA